MEASMKMEIQPRVIGFGRDRLMQPSKDFIKYHQSCGCLDLFIFCEFLASGGTKANIPPDFFEKKNIIQMSCSMNNKELQDY